MDRATVSPFGKNNNLFHLAGRRGRGPRGGETLLGLSVSKFEVQRSTGVSQLCLPAKKKRKDLGEFWNVTGLCRSVSSVSPQLQCLLWQRKISEERKSLLWKTTAAGKYGATFTDANAETRELEGGTEAVDRMMQYGRPGGLRAGCSTVIPPHPSCVISHSNSLNNPEVSKPASCWT